MESSCWSLGNYTWNAFVSCFMVTGSQDGPILAHRSKYQLSTSIGFEKQGHDHSAYNSCISKYRILRDLVLRLLN